MNPIFVDTSAWFAVVSRFVIVPIKAGALLIVLLYVAMQLKGLDTAFALDEHFRQAGFQVLP